MVLLYEEIWEKPTPKTHAPPQAIPAVKKFSPDLTSFLGGLVVGFIVLPILLPVVGYQLTKRYGPPPRK